MLRFSLAVPLPLSPYSERQTQTPAHTLSEGAAGGRSLRPSSLETPRSPARPPPGRPLQTHPPRPSPDPAEQPAGGRSALSPLPRVYPAGSLSYRYSRLRTGSPGRTGGPGEKRAVVALTHPEDEVKAEKQVFDALSASFDRHGAGWTVLNCTGVGPGRAAGTGGTRLGPTGCGLLAGLRLALLKKCHSLPSTVGCGAHVPWTPPLPRPRPHLPRPRPAARPRPGSGDSSPIRHPAPPSLLPPIVSGSARSPSSWQSPSYAIHPLSSQPSKEGSFQAATPCCFYLLLASPFRFSPHRGWASHRDLYFGRSPGQVVRAQTSYPRPAARTMRALLALASI